MSAPHLIIATIWAAGFFLVEDPASLEGATMLVISNLWFIAGSQRRKYEKL